MLAIVVATPGFAVGGRPDSEGLADPSGASVSNVATRQRGRVGDAARRPLAGRGAGRKTGTGPAPVIVFWLWLVIAQALVACVSP